MDTLARTLSDLMARQNYRQSDLARHLGVDRAVVSRWMRGSQPSIDNLEKIAAHFGVDIRTLIPTTARAAPSGTPVLEIHGELSESDQEAVEAG